MKPQNIKLCKGCGKLLKIEGGVRQERCHTCAPKTPERRSRLSEAMKRKCADPAYRAALLERMANARALVNQDLIDRSKQARALSESRMAWCPVEYRDYYRELSRRQLYNPETKKWYKFGAKAAREKIERSFGGPLRPFAMTTADASLYQCRVDGKIVKLSPVRLTLMLHFVGKHPDHYTTREELIELLWPNANTQPDAPFETITSHILQLRRMGICIVNRHGGGYRLAPQVRASSV